jgi:uncharacterized protein
MSMVETLKQKLTACRRAGRSVEMGVLQVVLGELSMMGTGTGKPVSDEVVEKVVRKTMLGNQQTLALLQERGMTQNENFAKLTAENVLLQSLLPDTLTVADIAAALDEVSDRVKAAKNDGEATGVAMKHLKGMNLRVVGNDVAKAVKQLRGG